MQKKKKLRTEHYIPSPILIHIFIDSKMFF